VKSKKLHIEYNYDFTLLGLATSAREYKLAWHINSALGVRLVKQQELSVEFLNDREITISHFLFKTEYSTFRLLKNKSLAGAGKSGFLLAELAHFDYLIMINDDGGFFDPDGTLTALKSIPVVEYLASINIDKLKEKENLIFE
jgi:hypothetical protein